MMTFDVSFARVIRRVGGARTVGLVCKTSRSLTYGELWPGGNVEARFVTWSQAQMDLRLERHVLVSASDTEYILSPPPLPDEISSQSVIAALILAFHRPSRWGAFQRYLWVMKVWRKIKLGMSEIWNWLWARLKTFHFCLWLLDSHSLQNLQTCVELNGI